MKKNYTIVFAAITALIALCAFWGCSSGDDNDDGPSLPPAEEAWLGDKVIMLAEGEQVYQEDGTPCVFNPGTPTKTVRPRNVGASYVTAVETVSSIDEYGILTLKLPPYNTTYWTEFTGTLDTGLTADPPDVKHVMVEDFGVSDSEGFRFRKRNETWSEGINYIYVDKDARIYGVTTVNDAGGQHTVYVNLILKKGWNLIITKFSGSDYEMKTGIPGDEHRWIVS
jgi:hypothetical protein